MGFFGVIDESAIFPWPEPSQQEADTLHTLLDGVRRFFQANVRSAEIDREHRVLLVPFPLRLPRWSWGVHSHAVCERDFGGRPPRR